MSVSVSVSVSELITHKSRYFVLHNNNSGKTQNQGSVCVCVCHALLRAGQGQPYIAMKWIGSSPHGQCGAYAWGQPRPGQGKG